MKYIGSICVSPKARWNQHIDCAFKRHDHHWNYPLMQAFREFGLDNFSFEVIYVCQNNEEMLRKEQYYIDFYNSKVPNGYNQTRQTYTPTHDEEVIEKMKKHHREKLGKKICEIDKNDKIINQLGSLAECSETIGISKHMISGQCHSKWESCHGRRFRYLDEEGKIIPPAPTERKAAFGEKISKTLIEKCGRPVVELNDNGDIIGRWNSLKECAADTGCDARRLSDVCNGRYSKYKGRRFSYANKDELYFVYDIRDDVESKYYYGILPSTKKVTALNIFKTISEQKKPDSCSILTDFLKHDIQPYSTHTLSGNMTLEDAKNNLKSILDKHPEKTIVYNFDKVEKVDKDLFKRCIDKINCISFSNNKDFVNSCAKVIIQFDVNGNEVKRYSSLKEAASLNNYNTRSISACAHRRLAAYNGFYWRFEDDVKPGEFDNPPRMRRFTSKIYRVDEEGNILETFSSIKEACTKYNLASPHVSDVCRGKAKAAKGYIFRYAD